MKEHFGEKETWKGVNFWTVTLIEAGVMDSLKPFDNVITGKEAPNSYGEPVLQDVLLGGRNCDVYHSDKNPDDTYHRIFIHIKSEPTQE